MNPSPLSAFEDQNQSIVAPVRARLAFLCGEPSLHARFLNMLSLLEHIGSRRGVAVRGNGRPDFRGRPGTEFEGVLADVTTWADRAAHFARYYGEKMLVLGYNRR